MGKAGIITRKDTDKDNEAYHDIVTLLKIYRSVNWRMQAKIGQVKRRFQAESGSKENTSSLSVHEVEERYEMDEEEIALDYACFETANLCYRIDYFPVAMTIAKKQVDK